VLNFQQITMPYCGESPTGWDVIHVDEEAEEIDWDSERRCRDHLPHTERLSRVRDRRAFQVTRKMCGVGRATCNAAA